MLRSHPSSSTPMHNLIDCTLGVPFQVACPGCPYCPCLGAAAQHPYWTPAPFSQLASLLLSLPANTLLPAGPSSTQNLSCYRPTLAFHAWKSKSKLLSVAESWRGSLDCPPRSIFFRSTPYSSVLVTDYIYLALRLLCLFAYGTLSRSPQSKLFLFCFVLFVKSC